MEIYDPLAKLLVYSRVEPHCKVIQMFPGINGFIIVHDTSLIFLEEMHVAERIKALESVEHYSLALNVADQAGMEDSMTFRHLQELYIDMMLR